MNSTINSIPERRYLNKTIEFQPSLYAIGTGRNYDTLKPKLQGRRNSPGGKYLSPYAQPLKKKKKKMGEPDFERKEPTNEMMQTIA
jgi:hypothetical protein